jgi:hypothetical protein
MSNTIGTYAVPKDPAIEEYDVSTTVVKASERMLDGTLRSHYVIYKKSWSVTWKGLTSAQRDLVIAQLNTLAHIAWTPPEGTAYTVAVQSHSWALEGSNRYFSVTAELEQV